MAYACRLEADSISPGGLRLVTMVVTYPRIVHSELMTHRAFSRSSASNRAIPVAKKIQTVLDDPFIPESWGTNQKGMQAGEELAADNAHSARQKWLQARDEAVRAAQYLMGLNVHKQITNRLLEPFSWITVIITATEWSNFFGLRCHPDAQPELRKIAEMMRGAQALSVPRRVPVGWWHLPFTTEEEQASVPITSLRRIAVGRCARVSYETHDGKRDTSADIELADRLRVATPPHAASWEHVATPAFLEDRTCVRGNFFGWHQLRHLEGLE